MLRLYGAAFIQSSFIRGSIINIAQLVEKGQLRPLVDAKSFTFADIAAAHAHAESGAAIGKIVLEQSFKAA
ncbi:MAG: zinc-binding dehydrogenase [Calothrix sp. MO_167.B42]|nr:zinc-binding dehydrogenase [Calothrix sp. MO_167.B42]